MANVVARLSSLNRQSEKLMELIMISDQVTPELFPCLLKDNIRLVVGDLEKLSRHFPQSQTVRMDFILCQEAITIFMTRKNVQNAMGIHVRENYDGKLIIPMDETFEEKMRIILEQNLGRNDDCNIC